MHQYFYFHSFLIQRLRHPDPWLKSLTFKPHSKCTTYSFSVEQRQRSACAETPHSLWSAGKTTISDTASRLYFRFACIKCIERYINTAACVFTHRTGCAWALLWVRVIVWGWWLGGWSSWGERRQHLLLDCYGLHRHLLGLQHKQSNIYSIFSKQQFIPMFKTYSSFMV